MHKEHGEDWAQHIYRDFHWLCLYDHDSPPQFSNAQSLRAHLAESHTTQFRSDQELDVIAERSKQSIALEAGFCPLCGDLVDAQTGSGDEPRDFGLQELKAQKKVSFQKEKQDRNSAAPSIETEALSECHDHAAGFGVTSVTLRRHIIEDLTTIAFYSLRWWDEHPGANEVASRDSISTGSIGSAAGKDSLLSENIVLDESTLNEMRETQRILGVQEERSALVVTNIPVVVTETQPHLQVSQYSRQSGRTTPENTPAKKATSDIAPIERSRAGLDDTRVTVCRDRGYHYHKQKHGHLYTSRFRGGPMLSGSTKDVVKMIRNELIDRASVSVMGGVSHRYLPHSQLRWILTRERIAFIIGSLTGFGELSDRERGNLVEEILEGGKQYCRKPCLKLLAASIRTDKGKSFSKLLKQRHATDGCLPPVWDWKGNVECHSCPKKHILFDVENTDSKEEFVKWTHILNAPYFTTPTEVGKKHTHYVLCEKDVLPVEERDAMRDDHNHDSRTSGRYGASSNVHMVKFHPEHYDLPHGTVS